MQVTFSLTAQDIPTWRKFYRRRRSEYFEGMGLWLYMFTLPVGFFAVPLAIFAALYFLGSDSGAILWITLASAAFWGPTYWTIRRRRWERKALGGWLERQWTIGVTAESVTYASSAGAGSYSWSSFADIGENSAYFFFFTNGGGVLLIPKRAFASVEEARAFADTAISYWSAKHAEATPESTPATWPPSPRVL